MSRDTNSIISNDRALELVYEIKEKDVYIFKETN